MISKAANLRVPTLIIYLDAEPEVALYRVQKRTRPLGTIVNRIRGRYETWFRDVKIDEDAISQMRLGL